jgi:DNA-binding CsgD family transcriptional regulator
LLTAAESLRKALQVSKLRRQVSGSPPATPIDEVLMVHRHWVKLRSVIDLFRTGAATLADAKRGAQESGASLSATLRLFEPHGVKDIVCVAGHDAGGHGVFVSAPRAGAVQLSAVEHRSLSGLATELASTTRLRELRSGGVVARFSAAEQRVVRWLLEGATDKEMAGHLGVTLSTVSSLMRRVRTKLGCRCGQEVLLLTSPEPVGVTRRRVHLFGRLTASERDIATDLLLGASHREMAIRRGTSPRTVAKQCGAVFRKCGVSGRRQLTAVLVGGLSGR